jgi:superfamily II DNA/RNA helicase
VAACEKKKDTVNVAHVINFDFPLNPVDYIHRIGRTGRGGGTGRVTNLVTKVCGHM